MRFEWRNGYAHCRLRVSIIGGKVVFTQPDDGIFGDVSFNDPIPLDIWHQINLWIVANTH